VTGGLPPAALLAARSYLTLRADAAAQPGTFIPFLVVFGCLGLVVAVLIVANVISGAVVAGIRHIGVLKALGFTPTQVMTVYLAMVSIPAIAGCLAGTVLGNVLARVLLSNAFESFGAGDVGVAPWVDVAALLGVPVVVALSALVPALRARSLSATEAISAGSAPHAGRGLRAQRWLGGTRLPRSVSLGLGLPFARPARSALTMAAVVLGVTSVTLAIGLANTLTDYQNADPDSAVQVEAFAGGPAGGGPSTSDDESLLRSLPGTADVTASADLLMRRTGTTKSTMVRFWHGDSARSRYRVLEGHWLDGPGQVAVSERFLLQQGLALGDTLTLDLDGKRTQVRIVAELLVSTANVIFSNWQTLALVASGTAPDRYEIQLRSGTDTQSYLAAVKAAAPRLDAFPADNSDQFIAIIVATVTLLTLMLGSVAALGVFNTVVLNTRERRRDLGLLKSIGMTPRQVTVMMVTSMAALGALSGLLGIPIGIIAHHLVLPAMARAAQVRFLDSMLEVYQAPLLVLLAVAGIGIAAIGALIPARSAARITVAEALQNE
jgi:putative ABC transport system permease protein